MIYYTNNADLFKEKVTTGSKNMKTGTYYNLKCLYEYYQLGLPPTAPPLECMEDDRLTGVQ